jgi:hypothetical protein
MSVNVTSTYPGQPDLPQTPCDVAVVIPTIVRPGLLRAVLSVFRQRFEGRIQVLLGIDKILGDRQVLDEIEKRRPANCVLTILDLGYSTSIRHGGLHPAKDGGTLRTILSYAANSRYVAYLDDDNWFAEDHLSSLLQAISGAEWAFSLRWYVDEQKQEPLCVDEWESVGPHAGFFNDRFGGFVDPNCLMIDKLQCEAALRWWSIPLYGDPVGMSGDRHVFKHLLQHHPCAGTGRATSYYVIHAKDAMHPIRQQWIREKAGVSFHPGE